MFDKIFFFLSLLEVQFMIILILIAAAVDVVNRLILKYRKRNKEEGTDFVLIDDNDNIHTQHYENSEQHFRKSGQATNTEWI